MEMRVRNATQALARGLRYLLTEGIAEDSRAGRVLVAPEPVITVTERPAERVLHSAARDANPFFHLWEAAWMLTGRDDADTLNLYVRDFGERFAEENGRIHGAYGARWIGHFGHLDDPIQSLHQLDWAVGRLRQNPQDRQVVLTMWDPACDTTFRSLRDRPCNTHVYLRARRTEAEPLSPSFTGAPLSVLDLTVCCRSNDAVWGAHGANAVHFSVLQEYLAARIGVDVGRMIQVSNNYHVYEAELERIARRVGAESYREDEVLYALDDDRYGGRVTAAPLITDGEAADRDLERLMRWHDECRRADNFALTYGGNTNLALAGTLAQAARAHWCHRHARPDDAQNFARLIPTPDWRAACVEWLQRRDATRKRAGAQPTVVSTPEHLRGGAA